MLVRLWNSRPLIIYYLMETQNGKVTSEDRLKVSQKTKYILPIWPSTHAPWYLAKEATNIYPNRNLHVNVYSSFIQTQASKPNNPNPACPSVGEWINGVHGASGILISTNKKWCMKTMEIHGANLSVLFKWKEPIWKGYILLFFQL